MNAQRPALEPLPKAMAQAYQFAMLGETNRFRQDLHRLMLLNDISYQEKESNALNIGLLMKQLEADKALNPEILDAITECGVIQLDFRVQVRRIIADRLIIDKDGAGFASLLSWYIKHVDTHRFNEPNTFLHDDYAHINFMCAQHLDTDELLSTFSKSIPLNTSSADILLKNNTISKDRIIDAMRLNEYLYPIQDSSVLQAIFNYEKNHPEQKENVLIADFFRYMDFVYDLAKESTYNRPDLSAKVLDLILKNPQSKHGSFNLNSLTSYRVLYDPSTRSLMDVLKENEDRIIKIIRSHITPDVESPRLMHSINPIVLKRMGTDKSAGLNDAHRHTIIFLAEQGMIKLAKMMSLYSTHAIHDDDHLQVLTGYCGPLSKDEFISIYTHSVAGASSSMADSTTTRLTSFLHYAKAQGWDMPWRHNHQDAGIQIISAHLQLGNLQAFVRETECNNEDNKWALRQLNNALIAMDKFLGTDYGFDLKATAEANLDRDILMQLSHYKRLTLSEDLDL